MKNIIIDVDDNKSILIQENGEEFRERNVFNVNEMMGANYWLMEGSNIKFKLNVNQMKIIKIAMAMVNPKEKVDISKPLVSYSFTVDKLLEILGIDYNQLKYEDVPDFLKELTASDNFSYSNNKGHLTLIHMFDKVIYKPEKQEVTFRFSWSMIEDFLTISNKEDGDWQSYKLKNIMTFTSEYSMSLYGLCKVKLKGVRERIFDIDIPDFRIQIGVFNPHKPEEQKYPRYYDLKKNVIDKIFAEINTTKGTDIKISYTERKKGKTTVSLLIKVQNLKYGVKVVKETPPPPQENSIVEPAVGDVNYIEAEFSEVREIKEVNEEKLSDERKEILRRLREIIVLPPHIKEKELPASSLFTIYYTANKDYNLIAEKYKVALTVKDIKNLSGLIVNAIKGNYPMPIKVKNQSGSFNDYEQRAYDFDELEKKLLGWDNNDDENEDGSQINLFGDAEDEVASTVE